MKEKKESHFTGVGRQFSSCYGWMAVNKSSDSWGQGRKVPLSRCSFGIAVETEVTTQHSVFMLQ